MRRHCDVSLNDNINENCRRRYRVFLKKFLLFIITHEQAICFLGLSVLRELIKNFMNAFLIKFHEEIAAAQEEIG